jgi:hypothetical protein
MTDTTARPLAACYVAEGQRGTWINSFLPRHEPFFFQGEHLVNRLLKAGLIVYTRPEFHASFPQFALAGSRAIPLASSDGDESAVAAATLSLSLDKQGRHVIKYIHEYAGIW